jgi:hypothetical protein
VQLATSHDEIDTAKDLVALDLDVQLLDYQYLVACGILTCRRAASGALDRAPGSSRRGCFWHNVHVRRPGGLLLRR